MKTFLVDVLLNDQFEVEAECAEDAVAEAVKRAIDYAGAMCVETTVLHTAETEAK